MFVNQEALDSDPLRIPLLCYTGYTLKHVLCYAVSGQIL